jgi:hypothetical protein
MYYLNSNGGALTIDISKGVSVINIDDSRPFKVQSHRVQSTNPRVPWDGCLEQKSSTYHTTNPGIGMWREGVRRARTEAAGV